MTEYEAVIEVCVRRMAEIVGKRRAVERARSVDGLAITDEGTVEAVDREGRAVLGDLVDAFGTVGGDLVPTIVAGVIADEFDVREIDLPDRLAVEIERAV